MKETELSFAARTAWRNAPKCIGRMQWSRLQVFDARYVTSARGFLFYEDFKSFLGELNCSIKFRMFQAICNHLKYAYNQGQIRSAITIFKQRTTPGSDYRFPFFLYSELGLRIVNFTIISYREFYENFRFFVFRKFFFYSLKNIFVHFKFFRKREF